MKVLSKTKTTLVSCNIKKKPYGTLSLVTMELIAHELDSVRSYCKVYILYLYKVRSIQRGFVFVGLLCQYVK
jgi:hypothetical protein